MLTDNQVFSHCIYTMKKSENLEYCYVNGGFGKYSESKSWRTGYKLLLEAKRQNKIMPIVFSAAEEASGMIFVAFLENIILQEDQKEKTIYSFKSMIRLKNPKPLSSLILKNTNKPLSDNYIRPYAICYTPVQLEDWIEEQGIPTLEKRRKSGMENFNHNGQGLGFTLNDFWQWSSSDLVNNSLRGVLAEYLVAKSLGIADGVRSIWDAYDLLLPNGIKIEVKSAAYLQSWYQKEYSKIIFSVRRTREWSEDTNIQGRIAQRQADMYVFCLLKHKVQETINPLDVNQWEFFVLPTKVINDKVNECKSLSLAALKRLNPVKVNFKELKDTVYKMTELKS